ncbi:ATP-dependent DNA helicase RecG [candidate division WOR-1 bacterium RIFCSPHIGHO2_02_FULL_53_26]|nr:MAG: ATP-dependent DNA helicase RecG [candidate division WOR-1 bacterium RIFCSPHIGHO2_02_FULL_53_26]
MSNSKLATPIQYVKGVGPKLAKIFAKLGVFTVEDLLYLVPREWEDRSNIKPIAQIRPSSFEVVKGEIRDIDVLQTRSRFSVLKVYIGDRTATIQAVWFNQPFLKRLFRPGMKLIVSGKVELSSYDHVLQLCVRDFEIDTGDNLKIVPRYPLTEGLYPKKLRSVIKTAIETFLGEMENENERQALLALHEPQAMAEIGPAREYLAFEELFMFQLGLLLRRKEYKEELRGRAIAAEPALLDEFRRLIPFVFTAAQDRVLADILADLKSGRPMNRLLQGDVGSGKTIVAALAAFLAVKNGFQAAILAPTEILAQQHYGKLAKLFEGMFKVVILTSATATDKKREELFDVDLVIGTHALLEAKVKFKRLALVVIDEQHRFGVHQRAKLLKKGVAPHLLVMTATPIPRSLALTLYGDLDRSIIDELPPGRMPVKTYYVPKNKRSDAYEFIRLKAKEGRQVFFVCPLVEESQELDLKAAVDEARRLQNDIFPELKVGLLHGRLKGVEKDAVMKKLLSKELDLLVSTTVIEVGIDVPNATVMVIEHAERFGLSQLHQLRGRIGRGSEQSYCFLIGDPGSEEARARLKAMIETNDGFKIAEADLRLRGPGEMLGARQSGLPNFRVADIIRDEKILQSARAAARDFIERDPKGAHNRWESQKHTVENSQKKLESSALN